MWTKKRVKLEAEKAEVTAWLADDNVTRSSPNRVVKSGKKTNQTVVVRFYPLL